MKDKGWRGFIGTLKCFVGLHDWMMFDGCDSCPPSRVCNRCKHKEWWPWKRCRVRQTGNVVMGDMAGGDIIKCEQPNAEGQHSAERR